MNRLLTEKYQPRTLDEFVLPSHHQLGPVLKFAHNPYGSAFLFTGKSGLGKTTLAMILAQAASQPLHIQHYVGSDLDTHRVRDLELTTLHQPMFGGLHTFVIDEADGITEGGQLRLLKVLDFLKHSLWLFTSNEDLSKFEDRFLSRLKCFNFTSQGLVEPGSKWLCEIARKENYSLEINEAEKIFKASKNNFRSALQLLERRL